MYTLELATLESIAAYCTIMEDAKRFQREQGFTQWTSDYPNIHIICEDISRQKGYAFKEREAVAGYLCIDFDGEPAYDKIQGAWHSKAPYAVVHRLAFSRAFRAKGLSGTAFALVEDLCRQRGVHSVRIDTDACNARMQHILNKCGFAQCGIIVFQGSEKLAFDKTF